MTRNGTPTEKAAALAEERTHTQGEWAITERTTVQFNELREVTGETLDSITIETRGSCHVVDKIIARVDVRNPAARANARLLLSAPKLLAERKEISAKLGILEWSCPEHAEDLLKELIESFYESAAVKKAEGV